MTDRTLPWLSLADVSRLIRKKQLSPLEYTLALIGHIEKYEPVFSSFITFTPEIAVKDARAASVEIAGGEWRGHLHGIPYALKDLIDYGGVRTTAHSAILRTNVARSDAAVTRQLKDAGAVFLGKLACHSFGIGMSDDLPWPHPLNPWNTEYFAGGSSSGSGVAVAAGFVPLSIGTDTGGSVRSPASMCGIVGMKPTYDLIGRTGVVPLSYSLDHVGTLTRSVEDSNLVSATMSDARPARSFADGHPETMRGLHIGLIRHFYEQDMHAHPTVRSATERAVEVIQDLGATVDELTLAPLQTYTSCAQMIMHCEAYAVHRRWLERRPEQYGAATRERLLAGAFASATDYIDAQRLRASLQKSFIQAMAGFDVAISVGSLDPPCRMDDSEALRRMYVRQARWPFNLLGCPALSLPIGLSPEGLPLGLQVVGKAYDDAMVYKAAWAFEAAEGGVGRPPSLDPNGSAVP